MKHLAVLLVFLPVASFAQTRQINPIPNPSAAGSIQPNWSTTPDGGVLLSWVEPQKDDTYVLRYAVRRGSAWSEARTIVSKRRFFRHPAEAPGMISLADGTLLAHWVENGTNPPDSEYIYVSSSRDGKTWTAPAMAHKDRSPVQHGLASMVPSGDREASLLWLQALKGEDGPISLMRTVVGADGKEIREEELDNDVCTCCPTSTVKTAKGLLVAYRDHTPKDIRDIAVMRFENGRWSASKILNRDNWEISACPVNAASASANSDRVAISWYTEANDVAKVQLVFSSDSGATFSKPVLVSNGPTFGYTTAVLTKDGGAVVSWLEETDGPTRLLVRRASPTGVLGPVVKVAEGSRPGLGYPRLLQSGAETWIAWGDPKAPIKTAQLNP